MNGLRSGPPPSANQIAENYTVLSISYAGFLKSYWTIKFQLHSFGLVARHPFFVYQMSWIFVINQVPCVSSCWGRRHTPIVCNESMEPHTSHYPSPPVTKKNNQQTTHSSHYPSRNKILKSCNDIQVKKTICNKFLRTHLCRSQFLGHRPHFR